jgi:hypothetical protein
MVDQMDDLGNLEKVASGPRLWVVVVEKVIHHQMEKVVSGPRLWVVVVEKVIHHQMEKVVSGPLHVVVVSGLRLVGVEMEVSNQYQYHQGFQLNSDQQRDQ